MDLEVFEVDLHMLSLILLLVMHHYFFLINFCSCLSADFYFMYYVLVYAQ